jgi:histidinol phosphatase-like PHP family hydrolase
VDWYVEILTTQPIDILANVSWLPPALGRDYDSQWTEARILRVVEAAVKQGVAIELSSGFRLPGLRFLRVAKEAGVRFTFGSNGRYPNMGLLDYSVETARALGLKAGDMFTPTKGGCRAAREA